MVKNLMDETKKGFMQNIGDLSFIKIDEANYEYSIIVQEKFLNIIPNAKLPFNFFKVLNTESKGFEFCKN